MASWRSAWVGLLSGLVFAAGLVLSGMTDPARVLGFLDFAGDWDPRLALVMVGAIGVHFSALRWAARSQAPQSQPFSVAPHARITRQLVVGAALFGAGWGLAGYCPGPALVSLGLGAREGSVFLLAMLGGMGLFQLYNIRSPAPAELSEGSASTCQ
jgi:uncharacterized membrane protein YedE/YeeE